MFRFSLHRIENDTNLKDLQTSKWIFHSLLFISGDQIFKEIAFQHSFRLLSGNGLPV